MGNVARSKTTRGEGLVPRSTQSGLRPALVIPRSEGGNPGEV